jgi:glycosyltransferase involved in cell wall biosynthesis
MRILHTVEYYAPSVGGAQEVVRQISEQLARRGHDVTVATTALPGRREKNIDGVLIEEFEISGNAVRGYSGEIDRYTRYLRNGDFDVMMNYAAQQWATDLAFTVLDAVPYRKVLAPCGFSALYDSSYAGYFGALPSVMRRYDEVVFHSNDYRDRRFAREHGVAGRLIPNGASREEFERIPCDFRRRHGIDARRALLLTVGSHTGAKGHRAAIEAFAKAKIGPSTLVVIGDSRGTAGCFRECRRLALRTALCSAGRKRVLLLAPPREETVAAFAAADLFVFPSNLECSPIVLFEALAARTPFVTAAVGNAAEIAEWTGGGVVLPTRQKNDGSCDIDVADLARAIEDLIHDAHARTALADAGHAAWKARFTWETLAREYERAYAEPARGESGA